MLSGSIYTKIMGSVFLDTNTTGGFANDGTVDLHLNSLSLTDIQQNLPLHSDSGGTIFAKQILISEIQGSETLVDTAGAKNITGTLTTSQTVFASDQELVTKKFVEDSHTSSAAIRNDDTAEQTMVGDLKISNATGDSQLSLTCGAAIGDHSRVNLDRSNTNNESIITYSLNNVQEFKVGQIYDENLTIRNMTNGVNSLIIDKDTNDISINGDLKIIDSHNILSAAVTGDQVAQSSPSYSSSSGFYFRPFVPITVYRLKISKLQWLDASPTKQIAIFRDSDGAVMGNDGIVTMTKAKVEGNYYVHDMVRPFLLSTGIPYVSAAYRTSNDYNDFNTRSDFGADIGNIIDRYNNTEEAGLTKPTSTDGGADIAIFSNFDYHTGTESRKLEASRIVCPAVDFDANGDGLYLDATNTLSYKAASGSKVYPITGPGVNGVFNMITTSPIYADNTIEIRWNATTKQPQYRQVSGSTIWLENMITFNGPSVPSTDPRVFKIEGGDKQTTSGDWYYFSSTGLQIAAFDATNYGGKYDISLTDETFASGISVITGCIIYGYNLGKGSFKIDVIAG
jgi:hypothetical protein